MHETGRRRLTSWKEIATHLGRDVRTVLRWEKDRGLPVHRVPGITGRVVFAYTDELDAWARSGLPKTEESPDDSAASPAVDVLPRRLPLVAVAAIVAVLAFSAWRFGASKASASPLTIHFNGTAIIASSTDGVERWRYAFPSGETAGSARGEQDQPAEILDGSDIVAGVGFSTHGGDSVVRSGELLRFSMNGALKNTFAFEDRPLFPGGPYGPPWSVTDYRIDSGSRTKVAVAAHHYEWWPSLVTVLDSNWNRGGTFVNAGWVEHLHWVAPDRLAIAGFSNARDGAMMALLDPNAMDGQSPAPAGSQFDCRSCGPGRPLRYIVMPRSEVNRASISPFNRVVLMVKRDQLVARTIEIPMKGVEPAVDALYEFTPSLDLIRASYSDHYWDAHRELERQGKIAHAREQCPDRNGPREIFVWEPATGWKTVATGRSGARPLPTE